MSDKDLGALPASPSVPSEPEATGPDACPAFGEVRVFGDKICQFIERELEGDKWEVVGFVSPAEPDTASADTQVGTEASAEVNQNNQVIP
jgi:hypothetical protein